MLPFTLYKRTDNDTFFITGSNPNSRIVTNYPNGKSFVLSGKTEANHIIPLCHVDNIHLHPEYFI